MASAPWDRPAWKWRSAAGNGLRLSSWGPEGLGLMLMAVSRTLVGLLIPAPRVPLAGSGTHGRPPPLQGLMIRFAQQIPDRLARRGLAERAHEPVVAQAPRHIFQGAEVIAGPVLG